MAAASAVGSGHCRPRHRHKAARGRMRRGSGACAPRRPANCQTRPPPPSRTSPASSCGPAWVDVRGSRRRSSAAERRCAAARLSAYLVIAALVAAAPRGVPADATASCARDFNTCNDFLCLDIDYKAQGCTTYARPCVQPCNAWAASNLGGVCDQARAQASGRWFAGYPGWSLQVSPAASLTDMLPRRCLATRRRRACGGRATGFLVVCRSQRYAGGSCTSNAACLKGHSAVHLPTRLHRRCGCSPSPRTRATRATGRRCTTPTTSSTSGTRA